MAYRDHFEVDERTSCKIVTCDPKTNRIEAVIKAGNVIQIPMYAASPMARWPVPGEYWIVKRVNGNWLLEYIWKSNAEIQEEGHTAFEMEPGDLFANVPGKIGLPNGDHLTDSKEVESIVVKILEEHKLI